MGFYDGLKICMWFFQNLEIIYSHFFCIFNLDIFWVLILQKCIRSRYLVPITPTTVLNWSFWNFTGALRMVWRYACVFSRILKLFFITGFLLQYLGKWYRTNGLLVNLLIFNTSNKNKGGGGGHKFPMEFACWLMCIICWWQTNEEWCTGDVSERILKAEGLARALPKASQ